MAVLGRAIALALAGVIPRLPRLVEEAIRAAPTPHRQVKSLVGAILGELDEPLDFWLVIDDYHTLEPGSPSDTLVETLETSGYFRLIVASRTKPIWATSRRFLYGEILELGQSELRLTDAESHDLLSDHSDSQSLLRLAQGWPALVALAATADPGGALPAHGNSQRLYAFLVEEVFQQASLQAQEALLRATLLPPLSGDSLREVLGASAVRHLLASGLAHDSAGIVEIHPLIRDALHARILRRPDLRESVADSIRFAVENEYWDEAFELINRFEEYTALDELLTRSFLPLVESGRAATLEQFAMYAASKGVAQQPLLDLIDAEIALRDGLLQRAFSLGQHAGEQLDYQHPLRARAFIIAGAAAHLDWRLKDALSMFAEAKKASRRSRDANDASWGRCLSAVFLEDEALRDAVAEYESIPDASAEDRLRLITVRQHLARLSDGLYDLRRDEAVARSLLPAVSDPLVRTGWGNSHGYMLILQARYAQAKAILAMVLGDLDRYALAFGRPHIEWSIAAAELGLRQFARSDASLRRVEQIVGESASPYLEVNTRALRARLLLCQRRAAEAITVTSEEFDGLPENAIFGEYLGTHALALAVAGHGEEAVEKAARAAAVTNAVEVRVLAAAARAIALTQTGDGRSAASALVQLASRVQVWDPVVCAVRAFPPLLSDLAVVNAYRVNLAKALVRSNDRSLARSAGLSEVRRFTGQGDLSRREAEVIDLLGQGLKTRDIATALYISEATVKVHVQHILEKLDARTRAEAVARYRDTTARADTSETRSDASSSAR